MDLLSIGAYALGGIIAVAALVVAFFLRRVVPTNMTHIVQSSKKTTPYGKGKAAGNTYYAIPSWVPKFGVTVLRMPESIFQVQLAGYEAYDSARLPFVVDVSAFFRVLDAEVAANRVASFDELKDQLDSVLKGAVRRVLATNVLEKIMESRRDLGDQFTAEVNEQIKEWGVITVKTIEFMDLRDSRGSEVIYDMMAKEQSRISMESRIQVAKNGKEADLVEIEAKQVTDIKRQEAEQQVGLRSAEKDRAVGVAAEQAQQEVMAQAATTAERQMAVKRVEQEKAAEIARQVQLTNANAEGEAKKLRSAGELEATKNNAEGIKVTGEAEAAAQQLKLLAPVTAQTTLAEAIGSNENYQRYLLSLEQIKAAQEVGIAMATALQDADLKVIANGGDGSQGAVQGGVSGLLDMFSAKGGTSITGMLAALAQTPEGQALLKKVTGPGTVVDSVE